MCFHCNTKFMCVWMPWMFVILWCAPRGWQLDCRNVCMGYKYTLLIILVHWLVWLKLMTECTVRVNKNSFNTSFFQITVGLRLSQSVTLQAAPPLGGPGKAGCITVLCQKCFVCKFLYCFICIFGSWLHVGGAYFCVGPKSVWTSSNQMSLPSQTTNRFAGRTTKRNFLFHTLVSTRNLYRWCR